jgi:hypothetical protein
VEAAVVAVVVVPSVLETDDAAAVLEWTLHHENRN